MRHIFLSFNFTKKKRSHLMKIIELIPNNLGKIQLIEIILYTGSLVYHVNG